MRKLSVKISVSIAGKVVGEMASSLESFDAAIHFIPKRILNKIRNTQYDSVGLAFCIEEPEPSEPVEKLLIIGGSLDKTKVITWMYENGYFSLTAADMLTAEIKKGTFNL